MSGIFDAVALGWALSALLFFLSLWRPGAVPARRHHQAAAAGALLLGATTIYAADVVNLPEMIGALIIGGAIGLLLGRGWPVDRLARMITALAGSTGLAMIAVVLAAWKNPYAFDLIAASSDRPAAGDILAIVAAIATAALACTLGIVAIALSPRSDGGLRLLVVTAALAGWSVAATAFLLENIGLAVAGGLAGSTASMLAIRLCRQAGGKGLADVRRRP